MFLQIKTSHFIRVLCANRTTAVERGRLKSRKRNSLVLLRTRFQPTLASVSIVRISRLSQGKFLGNFHLKSFNSFNGFSEFKKIHLKFYSPDSPPAQIVHCRHVQIPKIASNASVICRRVSSSFRQKNVIPSSKSCKSRRMSPNAAQRVSHVSSAKWVHIYSAQHL
jgi:hypothetical protein